MIRTRVGYAGGVKVNPTYYSLGNHSETIQVDYDPDVIGYQELLEVFWKSHRPMSREWSTQYGSVVFYHDETQRRAAASLKRDLESAGAKIETEIVPLEAFHLAEDYHQKYYLKNDGALWSEVEAIYPSVADQINSTAVARMNGYIGRYGSRQDLEAEIGLLGLSGKAQERLIERHSR